jgi:sugar phosphate isomerase/epimerase
MSMNLTFGISTTVLREHRLSFALEKIALAGYGSAEIWPWQLEKFPEPIHELRALLVKLELTLSLHAFTGELNPLALDAYESRQARRRIAASFQLAAELGAILVVVHPGQRDGESDPEEHAWERLTDWVHELDELARLYNLSVGVELMERKHREFFMLPADAKRLISRGYQNIGITADLAHLYTHGSPLNLLGQLRTDWISHVHLSDSAPQSIHLPLGTGQMNIGELLHALEDDYDGLVSIEGSAPEMGLRILEQNYSYLEKLGYVRRK